jgi:KaiC/GvpD/RAD55 family RecA-like ATPase
MVGKIERVKTAILGLDELIEGGFLRGRTVLVVGGCGTGKSIFGTQFLYKGAVEYGENGVMLELDESPKKIREDAFKFGWDLQKLENEGKLAIIDAVAAKTGGVSTEKYKIQQVVGVLVEGGIDPTKSFIKLKETCKNIDAKRAVVDSSSSLLAYAKGEGKVRDLFLQLTEIAADANITLVVTAEIPEQIGGRVVFSKFGVEEYASDGIIVLTYNTDEEQPRKLIIRKMRSTVHSHKTQPFEITEKGIVVKPVY